MISLRRNISSVLKSLSHDWNNIDIIKAVAWDSKWYKKIEWLQIVLGWDDFALGEHIVYTSEQQHDSLIFSL